MGWSRKEKQWDEDELNVSSPETSMTLSVSGSRTGGTLVCHCIAEYTYAIKTTWGPLIIFAILECDSNIFLCYA